MALSYLAFKNISIGKKHVNMYNEHTNERNIVNGESSKVCWDNTYH